MILACKSIEFGRKRIVSAIDYDLNRRTPRESKKMSPVARRAAVSSALGSALEWIDFTAYGAVAATVLPAVLSNDGPKQRYPGLVRHFRRRFLRASGRRRGAGDSGGQARAQESPSVHPRPDGRGLISNR